MATITRVEEVGTITQQILAGHLEAPAATAQAADAANRLIDGEQNSSGNTISGTAATVASIAQLTSGIAGTLGGIASLAGRNIPGTSTLTAIENLANLANDAIGNNGVVTDRTLTDLASSITSALGAMVITAAASTGVIVAGAALVAVGVGLGIAALTMPDNQATVSETVGDLMEALVDAGAQIGALIGDVSINDLLDRLSELADLLDPGSMNGIIDNLRDLYHQAELTASPIILDLDGDGVETLSLAANTHFDHDGNGFAEQSGWVGGDDALLVRDINGNGEIDNGTELFGNNTLLANGTSAANGFAALAALNSNGDGVINANDTAWADLRLWRDANNNAHVDDGELITLGEAGVAALNLGYATSTSVDAAGNAHKQIGSFVKTDGSAGIATDVWFAADMARTVELGLVAVSDTISALPDMQGFGNVHSLHQAMARDESGELQTHVNQFIAETSQIARGTAAH